LQPIQIKTGILGRQLVAIGTSSISADSFLLKTTVMALECLSQIELNQVIGTLAI
jgi:hypothetical protein